MSPLYHHRTDILKHISVILLEKSALASSSLHLFDLVSYWPLVVTPRRILDLFFLASSTSGFLLYQVGQ